MGPSSVDAGSLSAAQCAADAVLSKVTLMAHRSN